MIGAAKLNEMRNGERRTNSGSRNGACLVVALRFYASAHEAGMTADLSWKDSQMILTAVRKHITE